MMSGYLQLNTLSLCYVSQLYLRLGSGEMNTKKELNGVKKLVLKVLENYPETRNSDTMLYIQCAKELGAYTVDDLMGIKLNIISIHKIRQLIQNRDGMYLPTEDVKQARVERQMSFKEFMLEV
jgi:hypothetical protein